MRLLIFSPGYPPLLGGGERYVQALAQGLAGRGHDVCVVTSQAQSMSDYWHGAGSATTREADGRVALVRLPIKPTRTGRRGLFARRRLMMLLSRLPGDQSTLLNRHATCFPRLRVTTDDLAGLPAADVAHAFNFSWEYPAVLAGQLARNRGLPLVVTPFAHIGYEHHQGSRSTLTMDHQRHLLQEAGAVLVLSPAVATGLSQLGYHLPTVHVLGGAVAGPVAQADHGVLACYGLPPRFILFLGRASHDKGAFDAVRAASRLKSTGHEAHLVLAGPLPAEFRRFLERCDPKTRALVHPLGLVSEAEKQALLATCLGLALPSRVDALGLVLLEAWWHGKPVIAAAAGGIPGIVTDGQTGLLVPFGDVAALAGAFARLASDPVLAARLGSQGQALVRSEYTWDRVVDRAEQVYRSLTQGEHNS